MFLQVSGVTKQYVTNQGTIFTALQNIELDVEEGEFVSLLGPSGCGKSTLLSLIAGLSEPTEGSVLLKGQKITRPGSDRGVVFQEPALFPWLTVFENVMFPLRKKYRKNQKEAKQRVMDHLKMVQLSRFADSYPSELSGGMQQRVAIARALAMDPMLLLMDEPFGALDEQTRQVLHGELERIWMETGKTILFVTHNIQEAVKLSDRVVIMGTQPGKVISDMRIRLPRPRQQFREKMVQIEQEIMDILGQEIDKVIKGELSDAHSG
ncbi:MAG: ABC transporter ATP-binding protein [Bacillaceae bacterium]|nr:ABC transporter ATP-binding protein [Bacillaceae bacterium]